MRLSEKQNLGLVLSGGGVKAAAFHVGVCMALREKGFNFAGGSKANVTSEYPNNTMTFKTYVGSSAGSVVSSFLASGHGINHMVDAFTRGAGLTGDQNKNLESDLKPISYRDIFALNLEAGSPSRVLRSLLKKRPFIEGGLEALLKQGFKVNGLFSTKNLERYLRENAVGDNNFSDLGVQLYVVATQLNHSRKVIFGPFEETTRDESIKYAHFAKISEACAASAALPPFFAPFGIVNQKGKTIYFFDGEIRDTLSTHVAADHGCDLVVASYSHQPYHFNEDVGSLHEYGMPTITNQALYQVIQQKIEADIKYKRNVRRMVRAVDGYLKQADIADEHREKLLDILISRTNYRPDVDYIYIHPSPHDYEMFFADHFSLNPKVLSKIVRAGFKAAMRVLRKYNV